MCLLPLLALAGGAVYFGTRGLESLWPASGALAWQGFLVALSAGWHAAWLVAVAYGRSALLWSPAFLICTELCRRGLVVSAFLGAHALWALSLEATLAACAVAVARPTRSIADRLAAWRRGCEDTAAQLRLAHGLVPRVWSLVRRAVARGDGGAPQRTHFADLAASLSDMDIRLRAHVSRVVLPEQLRQSLLTRARDLAAQSELAAIEASLALEHHALSAAAAYRDECAALPDVSDADRDALVRGGQAFLLESAGVATTLQRKDLNA